MLTNSKRFLNPRNFCLFFLILFSLTTFSLSETIKCSEQWTEIELKEEDWIRIGDAGIEDKQTFSFGRDEIIDSGDFNGAIWNRHDFSQKKGLLISFKPTIQMDVDYTGKVKYPYGFAIVFTASSIDGLIGEKGSGIGYQGIMNAVAFEFDFNRDQTNSDHKKPHFSVHYNISGPILASSEGYPNSLINKELPNFYDGELEDYYKNIIFEIQLIGNRIIVKSNRDKIALVDTTFTEFQKLLEQEGVHIGITSTMNNHKKVTISDFKISEVSVKEKGHLESNVESISAGEEVTLKFSIESTCGEKLKIYSNEYNGDDFILKINNEQLKPNSINFNDQTSAVEMVVTKNIEDTYTATVEFKGHTSSPTKFIVKASDVERFELCNVDKNHPYTITSELEQIKDYFYVPICCYDQFGNQKKIIEYSIKEEDITIKYPEYIMPNSLLELKYFNDLNALIKVPISTFGIYEIFYEKFIEEKVRRYEFYPKEISPEKSDISILYGYNIINEKNKTVFLRIKARDNYGRNIPTVILEKLKCDFENNTKISENPNFKIEQSYRDDYVALKVDINDEGKYTFIPKVKCDNIELTEFYCGYDSETKINNCQFFYLSEEKNEQYIQAYSDYTDYYYTYKAEASSTTPLILSLDEKDNAKLTEINFLDEYNSTYFSYKHVTVTAKLDNINLQVVEIGYKYAILLPNDMTRENFSSLNDYNLEITASGKTFTIPIKFYFLDHFMNNVQINRDSKPIKYIAFYRQNSFKLKASETFMLFDIYELIDEKYFGNGDSLEGTQVKLIVDGDNENLDAEIEQHSSYISIISHSLTKEGQHNIKIKYGEDEIFNMNLEIEARNEAYYLANENGQNLESEIINISCEELIKLTLLDKFENRLKDNQIFNSFAKISIDKSDNFMIKPNFDGKIHIINNCKSKTEKSITMKLNTGKEYTIKSSYSPSLEDVDPLNSYGIFSESSSAILSKNTVKINLILRDKYGNNIEISSLKDIKNNISVYVQGDNIKEIIPLTTTSEYTSNGYEYSAEIPKNGDYEVKIFLDNFPVECKGCFFRKDYTSIVDINESILYLFGNKLKIPLRNSFNKNKIKAGLINKNNDNIAFYYEQRDENLNEIKDTKSINFNLYVKDNLYYQFYSIGNTDDEKGFFKMYSTELEQVKKLDDNLYKISKSTNIFYYIYLTNSEIDTEKTPNSDNSMILLTDNIIYGKIDIPGSFILDIRTKNYKRIKNLDTSTIKIKIVNEDKYINYDIVEGPENGLYTVFLKPEKPGKYEFNVYYGDKILIDEVYTYICTCGVKKKLKMKGHNSNNNGNYIFFQLTDENDNDCYNLYNYKDISKKEFSNYLVKVASTDNEKIYKTETYYNHMTNTFIMYLDRHVSGKIKLSSELITIDESSNSVDLTSYILDENHFYVSKSDNTLNIKALDDNYKFIDKTQITPNDFDVALIRIINDDFVILTNDFTVKEDLTVDCTNSENLIDAKGKYLYVVYYKGKEIFCKDCLINNNNKNEIDISKTKIYHKEGNDNYIQNEENMILPLSKSNFPFFKINIMTANNNLVILENDTLEITLKGDNKIETKAKYSSNGNIYVYLGENGRKDFLELPPMTKLNLKVSYNDKSYDVNYYVLNNYVEKPTSIENCAKGAIPNIVNSQSLYIKRVDKELEIEIYLSGCALDELDILTKLSIIEEGQTNDNKISVDVIPTDLYGGYLLFLPNSIDISDKYYYILNKKSKSQRFELSVIPGYDINSIKYGLDENMDETHNDKLYTYFFVDLKDSKGNTITNVGRNLFANDFYGIDIGNLPYKLIYDETKKAFRCQIPINGTGTLNLKPQNGTNIEINISESYSYENSLFEFDSENGKIFKFKIKYKDDYYSQFNPEKDPQISFKYFTYNPVNDEIFIREIPSNKNPEKPEVTIQFEDTFPKYSIYGFIPLINLIPQVCSSCFKNNGFQEYIYSISTEGYIPHKIGQLTHLIKDKDRPIYLYLNDGTVKIKEVGMKSIFEGEKLPLFILKYLDNSNKIEVEFSDEINYQKLSINLTDYNNQKELFYNTPPKYVERYSYNAYNINILDNKGVTFFMEIRGDKEELITNTPKLYIESKFKESIKSIIIVNTCYVGVYYVKIIFNKSADIKYFLKFTDSDTDNANYALQLKVVSAFPNQIILNNKERINKRMISYNIFATNANAEQVCDERLNLYIDDCNLKSIKKRLIYEDGVCSLKIQFYGDAVIKSNIDNFYSEINNNDNSLYSINPQFSSISISPNIFTSGNDMLTINFKEKSPSLTSYNKNEIIADKKIYAYQYISPFKFKFIRKFSSLYASEYSYTADKFNFEKGKTYVLVGFILNNSIFPSFAYYNIEKLSSIDSITGVYFTSDKKSYSLPDFSTTNSLVDNSFKLDIPFLLRVHFLDSKGETIDFEKGEVNNLECSLNIIEKNKVKKEIGLIITQYNDNYFYIKIDTNLISELKNLPQTFISDNKSGYSIKIAFNTNNDNYLEYYLFFSLKENNYQIITSSDSQYGYPLKEDIIESFNIAPQRREGDFYTFSGEYNIFHICFYIDSEIINKHINKKDLSITLGECNDFSFVNSYRGCISFSANCNQNSVTLDIKYNNTSGMQKTINFKEFNFNKFTYNNSEDITIQENDRPPLIIETDISNLGNEYFNIYINGEKVKKYEPSFGIDKFQISNIPSSYFDTIPKIKNIMITYYNGINKIRLLTSEEIKVEVISRDYSLSYYNVYCQDPLDLKAGDNIKFYLVIKDKSSAGPCYNRDEENPPNIKISTIFAEDHKIDGTKKLDGYSQCEQIYYVDFEQTYEQSGDLTIKFSDSIPNCKLHIFPQDIEELKSSFYGLSKITAGQTAHLTFNGTDMYNNKINYFDLLQHFDIMLLYSNESIVEEIDDNYIYNIKVSPDNDKFIIDLKINIFDTFTIIALKDNKIMDLAQNFSLIVDYGNCSLYGADPEIIPIDNRREFYPGEKLTVRIQCRDNLGNPVTKEGKEIFTANIKRENDDQLFSYNKEFLNGFHLITFTPTLVGNYTVNITLNGKRYGDTLNINIQSIDGSKYNCMDRRQVDKIEECTNDEYIEFLIELLGDSNIASDEGNVQNSTLFKCPSDDSFNVSHTKDCGCPNNADSWNGFCYLKDYNPINQINSKKITCLTKLKINDPDIYVVKCEDGSCRFNEEECNTVFECPIGYIPCGIKCILINETCDEKVTCNSDEVLCWDLSCATGYDLCPTRITCPINKVLCPDGSCKESGHCIQPAKRTCEKNQYQCSDFTCVSNRNDCTKNKVCEPGLSLCENGVCQESCQEIEIKNDKYRCSNGEYVESNQLCPSDMFVPVNYVKCPNGRIAMNLESCEYVQKGLSISCPKTKPILCPDFSCVSKSSDCSSYIPSCPSHKPYQCWNNECRASIEECPTPITCRKETPILCQNGLCVRSVEECKEKVTDTCGQYRCFDGTCVASMELCPTHIYCGEGLIKCWNGACVTKVEDCRSSILEECPKNYKFRCPDGSCRKNSNDCSTISVCPPHLPIKCYDNSCRASINECPNYQPCPVYKNISKVSCPDGTCASSFEECNTIVTCFSNSPYLCSDNSCKAQLSDCPEPPHCSKDEFLCPDGSCVSSRKDCEFESCDSANPIKCEMNICTDESSQCGSKTRRCPMGYILCSNGECKTSEYLCDNFECPKNKPYLCKEGVCVHNPSYCDIQTTGCPYNAKKKCPDGSCIKENEECDENFKCPEGKVQCKDGSCIDNENECPNINGCYKDRPFKCADGTCINPETTNCSLVLCPVKFPFKCPNGYCVSKSSDCSDYLSEDDLKDCGDGLIMCIDGRCVESTDYCRPSFECETGYHKCSDGTCRVSEDICPKEAKCPAGRTRCPGTQICVKNKDECSFGLICPSGKTKCSSDGYCTTMAGDCEPSPINNNGCLNGGEKCPNGRCMPSLLDCSLINNACPDDDKPYLCSNGECIDDLKKCPSVEITGECEEGKERCPTGRCVENKTEIFRSQCSNNIGCPLNKPYRCSNGECVESERKCDVTTIIENEDSSGTLISNIVCDESKPYLCRDKSCVSDPNFCKSTLGCQGDQRPCYNGYCVDPNESCTKFEGFCPISNPIHCPSGTCVDDVVKCSTSFKIPSCSEGEFYCARLNQCLKKKLDCFIFYKEVLTEENKNSRRLYELENNENFLIDPLSDEDFIKAHKKNNKKNKDVLSLIEENDNTSDSSEQADSDTEKIDGVFCFDGTIAESYKECPIVPSCKMGQYRCENGGCAYNKDTCIEDVDYVCKGDEKKCPDGLCHKDCNEVFFHGCEVGQYQCTNGLCVQDKYDCIGHSMCPELAYPFRCMNGECKSSPDECELIERLGTVKKVTYSFNKMNKIEFSFAYDNNKRPIAKIEIPGNGFDFKSDYSRLHIREIPSSILHDSELYNNSAEFLFNVSNSIYGSEGVINFENSVMSPAFKIYSDKNNGAEIKFNLNGIVNIAHNEYNDVSGLFYYDYCLAKLKNYNMEKDIIEGNSKWECVERQSSEGQTEFQIKEFGVYSVILSPTREKVNYFGDSKAKNFFLENVKVILIVLACVVVVIALVFYIFLRVTRYRQKYHENRAKILLLQQQKQEYENMTTDIFGQTLGDNINGIVYKANPAYTVTEEIKKSGTSLEEEIEKLQIECRNVNDQNERLQKDIEEITDKYKSLSNTIENMNK